MPVYARVYNIPKVRIDCGMRERERERERVGSCQVPVCHSCARMWLLASQRLTVRSCKKAKGIPIPGSRFIVCSWVECESRPPPMTQFTISRWQTQLEWLHFRHWILFRTAEKRESKPSSKTDRDRERKKITFNDCFGRPSMYIVHCHLQCHLSVCRAYASSALTLLSCWCLFEKGVTVQWFARSTSESESVENQHQQEKQNVSMESWGIVWNHQR